MEEKAERAREDIISSSESKRIFSEFPELVFPDYRKFSISNIGNSILSSFGLKAGKGRALEMPRADCGKVVLIVIDGLGASLLKRALPKVSKKAGLLTSVFPSTTSSAYTSILRGAPPSVHGITGCWQRDSSGNFGQLVKYKSHPRFEKRALPKNPASLLLETGAICGKLLSEKIPCTTIVKGEYVGREFSKILGNQEKGVSISPFSGGAKELGASISRAIRESPNGSFISAYYDGVDSVSHSKGPDSPEALAKTKKIFRSLKNSLEGIKDENVRFVITADHGQVPVFREKSRLWYEQDEKLLSLLSSPPAGDNRAIYLYPKEGKEDSLRKHLENSGFFRENFAIFPSKELLEGGLFGPVPKANRKGLLGRIGEFTLISRNSSQLGHSEKGRLLGNHGSLTEDELFVPLFAGTAREIF